MMNFRFLLELNENFIISWNLALSSFNTKEFLFPPIFGTRNYRIISVFKVCSSWSGVSYKLLQRKEQRQGTCPSAIINNTWYWPTLCSTIVMAISMTGANDVGPVAGRGDKNTMSKDQ